MTETGHALYGGELGISDTHCSSLWWLDQLGQLAREGMGRVFRQSLVGADYGLLDQESLEPRPDYYATFLWKRLMGDRAFRAPEIEGPDGRLRAYRHCSAWDERGSVLLLINLRGRASRVLLEEAPRRAFVVSPAEGLVSRGILLNGVPVEEDLVLDWGRKRTSRKYGIDAAASRALGKELELPAFSYAFLEGRVG